MRTIEDLDGVRELNLADLMNGFEDEVMNFHRDDIDDAEWELLNSQYAFIASRQNLSRRGGIEVPISVTISTSIHPSPKFY